MVDRLTRTKRSWNMSRIKSGNTKPEKVLSRYSLPLKKPFSWKLNY